jgi:hypothetical protein
VTCRDPHRPDRSLTARPLSLVAWDDLRPAAEADLPLPLQRELGHPMHQRCRWRCRAPLLSAMPHGAVNLADLRTGASDPLLTRPRYVQVPGTSPRILRALPHRFSLRCDVPPLTCTNEQRPRRMVSLAAKLSETAAGQPRWACDLGFLHGGRCWVRTNVG